MFRCPADGKWENFALQELPALDACGAHFGVTPDSGGAVVYHHHVRDLAPFTFGCYGPAADEDGTATLVTLEACRALYPDCADGDEITVTTPEGRLLYDPWCPCFISGDNVDDPYNVPPFPSPPSPPLTASPLPPNPPPPSVSPHPPPSPIPPASLSAFAVATRQTATLSSTFAAEFAASNIFDGDMGTYCVTAAGVANWVSVAVPAGTPIGYVAVYNVQGVTDSWQSLLGSFEVWAGSSPGDTSSSSAVKCGEASYRNPSGDDTEPYVLWCGVSDLQHVTVKQTGGARYLLISELYVYTSFPAPPAPSPLPPPTGVASPPFTTEFTVSSTEGHLWIHPNNNPSLRERLYIKGANWAGFQADGCPHELWRSYRAQDYVDFLSQHQFNAVRLPLNSVIINSNGVVGSACGEYNGQPTLAILDDILTRLRTAGIFVVLDMHTSVYPEANTPLWCGSASSCTAADEAPIRQAWETLAQRYCNSHPNVIGADLYNEP